MRERHSPAHPRASVILIVFILLALNLMVSFSVHNKDREGDPEANVPQGSDDPTGDPKPDPIDPVNDTLTNGNITKN